MPGTVLSMQNIYLVKKNYANPLEGGTKPPEGDNSMKFVYYQLNFAKSSWASSMFIFLMNYKIAKFIRKMPLFLFSTELSQAKRVFFNSLSSMF